MATEAAADAALRSSVRRDAPDRQLRLWVALTVLAASLVAQQFVTLEKVKRALLERAPSDPVDALGQKAWSILLASWRSFATPADLAIAAAIVGALAYIAWAEFTRGTLTELLARAEHSPRVLVGVLGLTTMVAARCYLTPGQVFMGDSETHMLRSWMFAEHLRRGELPIWSNAWYGGFPLLANYGPLYFFVTAVLTLVLGDIHSATKLLLWLCHAASVLTMFWFLREVTRRNLAALVGAFAFALSFLRLHILLYQGDLQIAVLFAMYPAVLLLVERHLRIRNNARSTFVLTSLTLALLILNHHGYAFFGLVLLAVYLVARLWAAGGPVGARVRTLALFAAAEVAALAMTAFLWAPFMFAMQEYRGIGNSAFPILVPNLLGPIMLVKLFKWGAVGDGSALGYVGLSIGALAAVGVVHGVKRRVPAAVGLMACALASLLMARNHLSYNIKNVDFFLVFVCALAAWAPIALESAAVPARVAAICLAAIAIDLGPTTFQSVFREGYEFKQPMYARLAALDAPYKVIERQVLRYDADHDPPEFDFHKLGIPSAYAPTQTPLGFFHEGAGRSFGYTAEIVKNLHVELNGNRLSARSADGLYLLGVKYLVFRDRYHWYTPRLPASPLYTVDAHGILELKAATPLVLSRRVIAASDVPGYPATDLIREGRYLEPQTFDYSGRYFHELVEPLLAAMRLDRDRGVAAALISRDGDLRTELPATDGWTWGVVSFATDLDRVEVRYRATADSFGQLPYNYFPFLRVDLDGAPVRFYRSATNHIIVPLSAGEHTVTVRGAMPPLQAKLSWLAMIATILCVAAPGAAFKPWR